MTHPGLAVMLVVGVGLGAVLYYFFASAPEQQMPNRRQRANSRPTNNNRTCWSNNGQTNEPRNRRQDQKSCIICLEDTNKENAVRLIPCTHVFHKRCIEEWRAMGAEDVRHSCPICRDKIMELEEL